MCTHARTTCRRTTPQMEYCFCTHFVSTCGTTTRRNQPHETKHFRSAPFLLSSVQCWYGLWVSFHPPSQSQMACLLGVVIIKNFFCHNAHNIVVVASRRASGRLHAACVCALDFLEIACCSGTNSGNFREQRRSLLFQKTEHTQPQATQKTTITSRQTQPKHGQIRHNLDETACFRCCFFSKTIVQQAI